MKTFLSITIFLAFALYDGLYAQKKNTDKVELELQKYTIQYSRGGTERDITPYIIINGKYIEDRAYDSKFFKSTFKDCPKALDKSLQFVTQNRKARTVNRIGIISGICVGIGGVGYVLKNKNIGNKNKLLYSGLALMGGMGVSYLFRFRSKSIRHSSYKMLKSSIDYYDKNCYVDLETFDSKDDIKSHKQKNKYARKYIVKMDDLHKTSFLRANIIFLGLKLGKTSMQVFPGLELKYFKNGLSITGEFNNAIIDGEKRTWIKEFEGYTLAYPINTGKTIYGCLGLTYPVIRFTKSMKPITQLGKTRGIDLSVKTSKGKKLISYGVLVEYEFDKSIKKISLLKEDDVSTPFPPKTNSLNRTIYNPIFFQTSTNLSLGLNRTFFTSYTLETNDTRFSSKIRSTTLISTYAKVKIASSNKISDMRYRIHRTETPITFHDLKYTKLGFAAGVSLEKLKSFYGYGISLEGGLNPHLYYKNYSDYYGKLKVFFVFGVSR